MSAHTPGPWRAKNKDGKYDNRRNSWNVCDEDADCSEAAPITLKDGTVVAFAVASDDGYFSEDRTDANACLIAAAPALLDFVKALVKDAGAHDTLPPGAARLVSRYGQKLIDKATGVKP